MKYITYDTFQEAVEGLGPILYTHGLKDINLVLDLAEEVIAEDEEGKFFVVEELLSDSIERLKG